MSLDGRTATSVAAIDQEQLDQKLTKLIVDHNTFRTLLFRYIRRSLALCAWYVDQDYPSFFRQFDRTDKLTSLVLYVRDHALQSYQHVDRTGMALLNQVDILLARGTAPPNAASPLGAISPSRAGHVGSKNVAALNGHHEKAAGHRDFQQDSTKPTAVNGTPSRSGIPFNNNRLLYLAGEVKEAIRFWREQCHYAQSLEPKAFEMDRIGELRYLALTGDGSTIEEKARGVRISCEQARLVTDEVEPFLDCWIAKLSDIERPKEEQAHGQLAGHGPHHGGAAAITSPGGGGAGGGGGGVGAATAGAGHIHHGMSLDHRSLSSQSLGSPAASYSSQPWGPGAS
ncbi:hypothetical protein EDD21DRAFT_356034 [Dissophora ornata]|nr:hypothetical protein BGZ58_004469 [Dissophora ornata]KAI8598818.1 hypothetical protein EDD21DRAFT_356034 [Dissophora ornata]